MLHFSHYTVSVPVLQVLFGRTDKFGDATSIIAWDLMGNQMIKVRRTWHRDILICYRSTTAHLLNAYISVLCTLKTLQEIGNLIKVGFIHRRFVLSLLFLVIVQF